MFNPDAVVTLEIQSALVPAVFEKDMLRKIFHEIFVVVSSTVEFVAVVINGLVSVLLVVRLELYPMNKQFANAVGSVHVAVSVYVPDLM